MSLRAAVSGVKGENGATSTHVTDSRQHYGRLAGNRYPFTRLAYSLSIHKSSHIYSLFA